MSMKPRNPNQEAREILHRPQPLRTKPIVKRVIADALKAKVRYDAIVVMADARNRVYGHLLRVDQMNAKHNRMRGGVARADHKHSQFYLNY